MFYIDQSGFSGVLVANTVLMDHKAVHAWLHYSYM